MIAKITERRFMKECIPPTCKYEYCRQRSVDDKLFKEGVKAMEY